MEITDDGRGMTGDETRGLGFLSMQERAQELGGSFDMQTHPGSGTRMLVKLQIDWK